MGRLVYRLVDCKSTAINSSDLGLPVSRQAYQHHEQQRVAGRPTRREIAARTRSWAVRNGASGFTSNASEVCLSAVLAGSISDASAETASSNTATVLTCFVLASGTAFAGEFIMKSSLFTVHPLVKPSAKASEFTGPVAVKQPSHTI